MRRVRPIVRAAAERDGSCLEPEQNVARLYALMIERDLFGRVILVRHWGRIGSKGRERAEVHTDEGEAAQAMGKLAAAERQRGYQDL